MPITKIGDSGNQAGPVGEIASRFVTAVPIEKGTAMRVFGIAALVAVFGAVASMDARQSNQYLEIAYTYTFCECGGVCNAFCPGPNASVVVAFGAPADGPRGSSPAWAPDGLRIAYVSGSDIVVTDAFGSDINITNSTAADWGPAWSPDGQRIAFVSDRDGPPEIYVMNPDGSDVVRVTNAIGFTGGRPSWSPDSNRLAFGCVIAAGNSDICVIRSDGTGLLRLTDDPAWDGSPAWSPDGATIVLLTSRYSGGYELALMSSDGSTVSRIGNGVMGWNPAWSPDGRQIAFEVPTDDDGTGNYAWTAIYTMYADGSNFRLYATTAKDPAWKPATPTASFTRACSGLTCTFDATSSRGDIVNYSWDFGDQTTATGSVVSHTFAGRGTYAITLTVTNRTGGRDSWGIGLTVDVDNVPPFAGFASPCNSNLTCTFDASPSSDSDGTIVNYAWTFGDGTTGAGAIVSHSYASGGIYSVTLTVTDNGGATATATSSFNLAAKNVLPIAVFASACNALTCSFNASGSSDPDGAIVHYAWTFGDGMTGAGAIASHVYAAVGSYSVTLTVTDNSGATATQTKSTSIIIPKIYVGDLDGASTGGRGMWTGVVTIRVQQEGNQSPVANALVSGVWSTESSGSCTTDALGQCAVSGSGIPRRIRSVTFSVVNVAHATMTYDAAMNRDPDGDSTGTLIAVSQP